MYTYTFTANPQGDYRDKRIEYEFVSTNGYAAFVTLNKVTSTQLEFTLMRATIGTVTGRITAKLFDN